MKPFSEKKIPTMLQLATVAEYTTRLVCSLQLHSVLLVEMWLHELTKNWMTESISSPNQFLLCPLLHDLVNDILDLSSTVVARLEVEIASTQGFLIDRHPTKFTCELLELLRRFTTSCNLSGDSLRATTRWKTPTAAPRLPGNPHTPKLEILKDQKFSKENLHRFATTGWDKASFEIPAFPEFGIRV